MSDLEFHVEIADRRKGDPQTRIFDSFDEAAAMAVIWATSRGVDVHIDVITWSEEGAEAYGGDWAVEMYEEDPEASVFERIVVKANSEGRIP